MTRTKILILGALSVLASAALAAAKDDPKTTKVPNEIRAISALVGSWDGSGECDFGGAPHTSRVSMRCESIAGGYGVSCRSTIRVMPEGLTEEHLDLYGFDPGQGKYHWFAVTSGGDTHDHVGEARPDGSIEWTYRGKSQGKLLEERVTTRISADKSEFQIQSQGTLDGAHAWKLQGRAKRK